MDRRATRRPPPPLPPSAGGANAASIELPRLIASESVPPLHGTRTAAAAAATVHAGGASGRPKPSSSSSVDDRQLPSRFTHDAPKSLQVESCRVLPTVPPAAVVGQVGQPPSVRPPPRPYTGSSSRRPFGAPAVGSDLIDEKMTPPAAFNRWMDEGTRRLHSCAQSITLNSTYTPPAVPCATHASKPPPPQIPPSSDGEALLDSRPSPSAPTPPPSVARIHNQHDMATRIAAQRMTLSSAQRRGVDVAAALDTWRIAEAAAARPSHQRITPKPPSRPSSSALGTRVPPGPHSGIHSTSEGGDDDISATNGGSSSSVMDRTVPLLFSEEAVRRVMLVDYELQRRALLGQIGQAEWDVAVRNTMALIIASEKTSRASIGQAAFQMSKSFRFTPPVRQQQDAERGRTVSSTVPLPPPLPQHRAVLDSGVAPVERSDDHHTDDRHLAAGSESLLSHVVATEHERRLSVTEIECDAYASIARHAEADKGFILTVVHRQAHLARLDYYRQKRDREAQRRESFTCHLVAQAALLTEEEMRRAVLSHEVFDSLRAVHTSVARSILTCGREVLCQRESQERQALIRCDRIAPMTEFIAEAEQLSRRAMWSFDRLLVDLELTFEGRRRELRDLLETDRVRGRFVTVLQRAFRRIANGQFGWRHSHRILRDTIRHMRYQKQLQKEKAHRNVRFSAAQDDLRLAWDELANCHREARVKFEDVEFSYRRQICLDERWHVAALKESHVTQFSGNIIRPALRNVEAGESMQRVLILTEALRYLDLLIGVAKSSILHLHQRTSLMDEEATRRSVDVTSQEHHSFLSQFSGFGNEASSIASAVEERRREQHASQRQATLGMEECDRTSLEREQHADRFHRLHVEILDRRVRAEYHRSLKTERFHSRGDVELQLLVKSSLLERHAIHVSALWQQWFREVYEARLSLLQFSEARLRDAWANDEAVRDALIRHATASAVASLAEQQRQRQLAALRIQTAWRDVVRCQLGWTASRRYLRQLYAWKAEKRERGEEYRRAKATCAAARVELSDAIRQVNDEIAHEFVAKRATLQRQERYARESFESAYAREWRIYVQNLDGVLEAIIQDKSHQIQEHEAYHRQMTMIAEHETFSVMKTEGVSGQRIVSARVLQRVGRFAAARKEFKDVIAERLISVQQEEARERGNMLFDGVAMRFVCTHWLICMSLAEEHVADTMEWFFLELAAGDSEAMWNEESRSFRDIAEAQEANRREAVVDAECDVSHRLYGQDWVHGCERVELALLEQTDRDFLSRRFTECIVIEVLEPQESLFRVRLEHTLMIEFQLEQDYETEVMFRRAIVRAEETSRLSVAEEFESTWRQRVTLNFSVPKSATEDGCDFIGRSACLTAPTVSMLLAPSLWRVELDELVGRFALWGAWQQGQVADVLVNMEAMLRQQHEQEAETDLQGIRLLIEDERFRADTARMERFARSLMIEHSETSMRCAVIEPVAARFADRCALESDANRTWVREAATAERTFAKEALLMHAEIDYLRDISYAEEHARLSLCADRDTSMRDALAAEEKRLRLTMIVIDERVWRERLFAAHEALAHHAAAETIQRAWRTHYVQSPRAFLLQQEHALTVSYLRGAYSFLLDAVNVVAEVRGRDKVECQRLEHRAFVQRSMNMSLNVVSLLDAQASARCELTTEANLNFNFLWCAFAADVLLDRWRRTVWTQEVQPQMMQLHEELCRSLLETDWSATYPSFSAVEEIAKVSQSESQQRHAIEATSLAASEQCMVHWRCLGGMVDISETERLHRTNVLQLESGGRVEAEKRSAEAAAEQQRTRERAERHLQATYYIQCWWRAVLFRSLDGKRLQRESTSLCAAQRQSRAVTEELIAFTELVDFAVTRLQAWVRMLRARRQVRWVKEGSLPITDLVCTLPRRASSASRRAGQSSLPGRVPSGGAKRGASPGLGSRPPRPPSAPGRPGSAPGRPASSPHNRPPAGAHRQSPASTSHSPKALHHASITGDSASQTSRRSSASDFEL